MTHVFTKFKEAGKKPVNYFKFVLNPDCFGTSIENMFHVSFLVKEGKADADISVCGETGLPFITPKSKKKGEEYEFDTKTKMCLTSQVVSVCLLTRKHASGSAQIQEKPL